jgi:hypothetical protein
MGQVFWGQVKSVNALSREINAEEREEIREMLVPPVLPAIP